MAYLTNSIGAYSFVELTGPIAYRHDEVEIFNRPGVAGSGLRNLGSRGKPFTLTSTQYFATFTTAAAAIAAYLTLPGGAVQAVIRNGVNHGNYFVLEVEEVETFAVLNPSGNATSSHTVCQRIKWKLLG